VTPEHRALRSKHARVTTIAPVAAGGGGADLREGTRDLGGDRDVGEEHELLDH